MDAKARTSMWEFIETGFVEDNVPLGTPFPIAMMVAVKHEDAILQVRRELERTGLDVASVDKHWWPFGRRWRVAVKSRAPLPIERVHIEALLERLDGTLAKHDATVLMWVPLRPAPARGM